MSRPGHERHEPNGPFRLNWMNHPTAPDAGSCQTIPPMSRPLPEDFGLTERLIEEIRQRDERQARLFVQLLLWGCGGLWVVLTGLVYVHAAPRTPLVGLVMAPLLGALGAVIGGLPLAVLAGALSWIRHPPHPKARALERYEAATAGIRTCDVCVLARQDDTPKEGVSFCGRCGAWICPECRRRYDLRAIAALKRGYGGPSEST